MQYLVYVHNLADGATEHDALGGDAPVAPVPNADLQSYVRVWIDALEGDPAAALRRTVAEALEWPREHGEKVIHMTATTSLELELGPNFDTVATVTAALEKALLELDLGLAKSA